MNAQGMREYFDLVYNNLSSNLAPGLLDDEISAFLNRAQEIIVDQYYNKFEQSELARKSLSELIKETTLTTTPDPINNGLESYSKRFTLPKDVLYIVYEKCYLGPNNNKCLNNKALDVLPVTHDDYQIISKDPFRGYSKSRVLRLDVFDTNNKKESEIIYKFDNVVKYFIRYIKRPREIIIDSTKSQDCELNESLHKTLVEMAAQLAANAYKSN